MASIKGTKTEKNLLKSFAGESQARNRYTFAAKTAEEEKYPQIAELFLETAENERVHAKSMFENLEGGIVEITASYPAGIIGTTAQNLRHAADGEKEEYELLYPSFAKTAEEEGLKQIAALYRYIAKVETNHYNRFMKLLENVQNGTVFKKGTPVFWKCRKCGHIHEGTEPPNICPTCKHQKHHFQIAVENW